MSEIKWDVLNYKEGDIVYDELYSDNIKMFIKRGPGSWCGYIAILKPNKLPINCEQLNIECHGGLTYDGDGKYFNNDDNWFVYGWDYAHYGDALVHYYTNEYTLGIIGLDKRHWTIEDVKNECVIVAKQFEKLLLNIKEKS